MQGETPANLNIMQDFMNTPYFWSILFIGGIITATVLAHKRRR